jgi:cell division protein FtsB
MRCAIASGCWISDNVDPDLAGELMRKELNVVAPDEIVIPLKDNE